VVAYHTSSSRAKHAVMRHVPGNAADHGTLDASLGLGWG
jgi:hypothetical protein